MNSIQIELSKKNYEKRLDAFYKKFGKFNSSTSNPIFSLVEIIKGWRFDRNPVSKKLQSWGQSFKNYVFPLRQKLGIGLQILYYPCKPNDNEHRQYAYIDSYETMDEKVSNYCLIENELNAIMSEGRKYLSHSSPFSLTQNLHPTILSHSTLLDFIFSNADVTEENYNDSVTVCLNAFIELYNDEPKFRESLDDGLLTQAMSCASEKTQKYITNTCPALSKYALSVEKDGLER